MKICSDCQSEVSRLPAVWYVGTFSTRKMAAATMLAWPMCLTILIHFPLPSRYAALSKTLITSIVEYADSAHKSIDVGSSSSARTREYLRMPERFDLVSYTAVYKLRTKPHIPLPTMPHTLWIRNGIAWATSLQTFWTYMLLAEATDAA